MRLKLGLSFGSPAKGSANEPRATSHHAETIRPGGNCCEAAQRLSSRRILSDEAPLLPLADCDRMAHCSCSYRHHADRRERPRRQIEGAPSTGTTRPGAERRNTVGRRAEDRLEVEANEAAEPNESDLVVDSYYGYGRRPDKS